MIIKKMKFQIEYSNSTTTETINNPQLGIAYITVNGICPDDISLRDVPETQRQRRGLHAQPDVTKSLEHSLVENAEIWSELSKH